MATVVKSNGLVKPCCMPQNLTVSKRGDGEHQGMRGDMVVRICRTCKARHIELAVDPGHALTRGPSI